MFRIGLIAGMMLYMAGCSPMAVPGTPDAATLPTKTMPVTETPEIAILPTEGPVAEVMQPPPTSSSSGLPSLIEKAKADLAQRLSLSTDRINLVEAVEAEWSDSSLGCPQPGMAYAEVITPGYRIILSAQEIHFDYRTNRGTTLVLCNEQTSPPLQTEIALSDSGISPSEPVSIKPDYQPPEVAPSDDVISPSGPVIIEPDDQPPDPPGTPCIRGCPY